MLFRSRTGYKGVYRLTSGSFEVTKCENGKAVYLGCFGTGSAVEAAYARVVGEAPPVAAAAAAEAAAAAAVVEEAEGLRLHLSSRSPTGYTGVNKERRRFRARFNEIHLGCFDTAVEAAVLAYARAFGEAAAHRARAPSARATPRWRLASSRGA